MYDEKGAILDIGTDDSLDIGPGPSELGVSFLGYLIAHADPKEFPLISGIDLYGDTIIQPQDLQTLLGEWGRVHAFLRARVGDTEAGSYQDEVDFVRSMIISATIHPGWTIRFSGE